MIEAIWRRLSLGLVTTVLLGACASNGTLTATEVLNHQNCQAAEIGLRKVSFADVAKLRGSTLLSMSAPDAAADPDEDVLLFVLAKGHQPTPGYRFELKGARQAGQVVTIEFSWHTPAPDSVQAQVITFPCLVVGMERGDYNTVRAVDSNGALLGELRI